MRLCHTVIVLSGSLAIAFSANADIPVITGPRNTNQVGNNEAFDSAVWRTKASMPTPRDDFSISQINGKIYVAGGELFNNCTPLNTLEAYDPATDTWTTGLASMPTARWFAGAGTVNGTMYVVGGQLGCSQGSIRTVEAYDPATDTWTPGLAPMPTPARDSVSIAVLHDPTLNRDILYAIGGSESTGEMSVPSKKVEAYDPVTNIWTTKTPMLQERLAPVVAVVNGKIYAIGGLDHTFLPPPDKTVEEYDPSTNAWTMQAPMPTARGEHFAGGAIGNIIYVAGGTAQEPLHPETTLSTVEAYDPSTNMWSSAPDMLSSRTGLGAAVVGNTLYAVGGFRIATATIGQPFIYQITATNDPTSYGVTVDTCFPDGLNIDPATGVIFGVPTTPRTCSFWVTATNVSGTGSARVSLGVHAAPSPGSILSEPIIISSSCATGRTNQPFNFQVLTRNASEAAVFTAGGLPHQNGVDELTINPDTGLISGTPTSDGYFAVELTVTDGSAITHATLELTFVSDTTLPIITSSPTAVLVPGMFFSRTLMADPMNPNPIFSYIGTDGHEHQGPTPTSAGLPPGLTFNGVDTISGTYNPTPTPTATPGIGSAAAHVSTLAPDTIKIRPLFVIVPIANSANGTGVAPLNFIEPSPTPTPTPTATATFTPTPTPRATRTPRPTPTATFTPTPTATATATFTPTPTPTATFTPTPTPTATATIQITVKTNLTGLSFTVDGTTYTARQNFSWVPGSSHTIATTSPQSGGTGVQYVWSHWSDHGAISHTVAPTANTTYTATFSTQYLLTMTHGTGGTVSPGSGWRNSGTAISISATPNSGFSFSSWTGTGTGSYSGTNNPASITMGGHITENATFIHN
jgi:N-acetylneuraminic acid mutarotase